MKYVALLRGINVGGKNIIKMGDLRSVFSSDGFREVSTYIQSGNVIFDSPETNMDKLTTRIEAFLTDQFSYNARIVLKSFDGMRRIIAQSPDSWANPMDLRCSIAFVKPPLTPEEVASSIKLTPYVDTMKIGFQCVYMTTLAKEVTRSGFVKLIGTPVYQDLTIRNWNTTLKIFEMMN